MPKDKKKRVDDGGPDQSWLVTFSDCMTLLLCFFVLLLTFSSFDEIKFDELAGAFRAMNYDSLEENRYKAKESMIERQDSPQTVQKGSEIPTDYEKTRKNPRAPLDFLDVDMEKDRTVFYLPSRKVFWGMGISMTNEARDYLGQMGQYVKLMQCRVVVGESTRGAIGLRRSWRIMRFFTKENQIDAGRFSLQGVCDPQTRRFAGQPILAITLMNVKVEQ